MTDAVTAYDFRQPQPHPPEIYRAVRTWFSVLLSQWNDLCRREWRLNLTLRLGAVRRAYSDAVLPQLPENILAYPITWSNASTSSLLVVSRRLALAYILARLGEQLETLPPDRPLTIIETTLWERLLDQGFLALARASWAKDPVPQWQRGNRDLAPQVSQVFRHQPTLTAVELVAEPPDDGGFFSWFLSEAVLQQFFTPALARPAASVPFEEIIQHVPLQLTVQLGQVHLPLPQLQRVRPGDVLLLEQRLDEPVLVLLEGHPWYTAWPGRLGTHRAVQIAAPQEK